MYVVMRWNNTSIKRQNIFLLRDYKTVSLYLRMQDIKLLFVIIISYAVEARILHSREPYLTEVETKWQPSFIHSFEIHYIHKKIDILIWISLRFFPNVQLAICRHMFRKWRGAEHATSLYLKQCLNNFCRIYAQHRWVKTKPSIQSNIVIGIHCFEIFFLTRDTVYEYGLTLIPAFTSNDTHY